MYHLPVGKTWNASRVAEAIYRRGLTATVAGDELKILLPLEEYVEPETLARATTVAEIKPVIVGQGNATLKYLAAKVIQNLDLKLDRAILLSKRTIPDLARLKNALQDCGFICASEREIVMMYCPANDEVRGLLDEIDELEKQKQKDLDSQKFEQAAMILSQQDCVREQIEAIVASVS